MIDITILRAMAAAGATVEMILAAIEAAQASQAVKLADRRANDAARQQRNRQARRNSSITVTRSHVMSRGPYDAVCDPPQAYTTPPNKSDPKTDLTMPMREESGSPNEERGSGAPTASRPERASAPAKKVRTKYGLPADFVLTDADFRFAGERGWDATTVKSEFARFCDHAAANNRRQADWHAAWRNWVTSPYQKRMSANGQSSAKPSVTDVLARLCNETREDPDGLLPQCGRDGS